MKNENKNSFVLHLITPVIYFYVSFLILSSSWTFAGRISSGKNPIKRQFCNKVFFLSHFWFSKEKSEKFYVFHVKMFCCNFTVSVNDTCGDLFKIRNRTKWKFCENENFNFQPHFSVLFVAWKTNSLTCFINITNNPILVFMFLSFFGEEKSSEWGS